MSPQGLAAKLGPNLGAGPHRPKRGCCGLALRAEGTRPTLAQAHPAVAFPRSATQVRMFPSPSAHVRALKTSQAVWRLRQRTMSAFCRHDILARIAVDFGISTGTPHAYTPRWFIDLLADRAPGLLRALRQAGSDHVGCSTESGSDPGCAHVQGYWFVPAWMTVRRRRHLRRCSRPRKGVRPVCPALPDLGPWGLPWWARVLWAGEA